MKLHDPNRGRIRVGILRGGEEGYESSIEHGASFATLLSDYLSNKYRHVDIFIDSAGVWHVRGVPVLPADLVHKVDVVWNTAGIKYAPVLNSFYLPNIGGAVFLAGLLKNREFLKEHVRNLGLKIARHILLPAYQKDFDGPQEIYAVNKAKEVFNKFASPWLVRSFNKDENVGIHLAKTFPELVRAILDLSSHNDSILVEEFIEGRKVHLHSFPYFRNETDYHLPISEEKGEQIITPAKIETKTKNELLLINKKLMSDLGVDHYLKTVYILHPNKGIFLQEIEFSPVFFRDVSLRKAGESIGVKMHHLVDRLLEKALNRR